MMKYLSPLLILLAGGCALANPIAAPPQSFPRELLPVIALISESLADSILLNFLKLRFLPIVLVLTLANVLVYYFIFIPMMMNSVEMLWAEAMIVAIDAAIIQIASYIYILQREEFNGVKVYYSLLIALIGNVISWAILH